MENLLSIKAASQLMGIGKTKLHDLVNDGSIKCYRIGNRKLFDLQRHILPYLLTTERKGPRPKRKTPAKKTSLKHLDLN